jgi:hypothetical protein
MNGRLMLPLNATIQSIQHGSDVQEYSSTGRDQRESKQALAQSEASASCVGVKAS